MILILFTALLGIMVVALAITIVLVRSLNISIHDLQSSNQDLQKIIQDKDNEIASTKASHDLTNFLLMRREQQIRKQQYILSELAKDRSINHGDFIIAVQNITQAGSKALDAERVSIWLFDKTKTVLHCLDLYQKSENIHTEVDFLSAANYPRFFAALQDNRYLAIEDVQDEEILQELAPTYFQVLNIASTLIAKFESGGETFGLLMFEHTDIPYRWLAEEVGFVNSLADLLSLGLEAQNRQRAEESLRIEQKMSERLLLNVLPQDIARRLKSIQSKTHVDLNGDDMIIADSFENVTVLFADIVNFTEYAASISVSKLVKVLNEIFSEFDHLVELYNLEKIKTIGDAYMAVGGLPVPNKYHAEAIADMALEMQNIIQKFKRNDGSPFLLRIGIHTGHAIAGVIGKKKFIYDLWGDTVNVASRMESLGIGLHSDNRANL